MLLHGVGSRSVVTNVTASVKLRRGSEIRRDDLFRALNGRSYIRKMPAVSKRLNC